MNLSGLFHLLEDFFVYILVDFFFGKENALSFDNVEKVIFFCKGKEIVNVVENVLLGREIFDDTTSALTQQKFKVKAMLL